MGGTARTFRGGVHPLAWIHHGKGLSAQKSIEPAPVPQQLVIPLSQNIGAPAKPIVSVGDEVKMGQPIGEPGGFVSVPVHASVSGKVVAVEPRMHSSGMKVMSVVIENDGKDTKWEGLPEPKTVEEMEPQQIIDRIRDAGLVGMGGATFPAHVKLSIPEGKSVDSLLINGAECEPYLTADHRVMVEQADLVIVGVRALQKALQVDHSYIGIEVNKPDAIEKMTKAAAKYPQIEVVPLQVKYPQGGEKQLIKAILDREVPSGGLPADAHAVVQNVGTAAAVGRALTEGLPLIERVVTVTGAGIKTPRNLMTRIGTSYEYLIAHCGGFTDEPDEVISGGPMMGIGQSDLSVPVIKGTSGILVTLPEKYNSMEPSACIHCGRCVRACPMHLMPTMIDGFSRKGDLENAEKYHALDCIECGSCSYVCPGHSYLVQSIRTVKRQILAARRKK